MLFLCIDATDVPFSVEKKHKNVLVRLKLKQNLNLANLQPSVEGRAAMMRKLQITVRRGLSVLIASRRTFVVDTGQEQSKLKMPLTLQLVNVLAKGSE